jgi:hypothetical protein
MPGCRAFAGTHAHALNQINNLMPCDRSSFPALTFGHEHMATQCQPIEARNHHVASSVLVIAIEAAVPNSRRCEMQLLTLMRGLVMLVENVYLCV